MAEQLGESPTYLAKVLRQLVKVGILRAHRGVAGGVTLNRPPEDVTLLAIMEACQGAFLTDFCQDASELTKTCAFHQAAAELHATIVSVLSRWTLAHLLARPGPDASLGKQIQCTLEPIPKASREATLPDGVADQEPPSRAESSRPG